MWCELNHTTLFMLLKGFLVRSKLSVLSPVAVVLIFAVLIVACGKPESTVSAAQDKVLAATVEANQAKLVELNNKLDEVIRLQKDNFALLSELKASNTATSKIIKSPAKHIKKHKRHRKHLRHRLVCTPR